MNLTSRRAAAVAALLAATASCGLTAAPAFAQAAASTNIAPPAEKFAISPGGVDMRSGRYAYSQTDLSIGPETGGLTLTRSMGQQVLQHSNPFGNFSHNFDVMVSEKRIDIQAGNYRHIAGHPNFQIEIAFGGRSQTFRTHGATMAFEQTSSSGWSQLSYTGGSDLAGAGIVYVYKTADGITATFRPMGSGDCSALLRCAYVSEILEADGTRLSFEYDNATGANATRLRSVTSNRGYALLLEYSGSLVTKACVLNLAVALKPANNFCPADARATATYSYDAAGGSTRLASVTDPESNVWTFVNAANSIGFVKPGLPGPWLTNLFYVRTDEEGLPQEITTQQNFADGSSYSYTFDETPFVEGAPQQIAGGSFTDGEGHLTRVAYDFPPKPRARDGFGNVVSGGLYDPASPIVYQTTPGPVRVTDPLGRTTVTDYCDPRAMLELPANEHNRCIVMPVPHKVTDPDGIETKMVWDVQLRVLTQSRQIAKTGSSLPDLVRSATYNCSPENFRYCNKPTSVTDAKGNVTTYTYDPAHGGVLTETGPAPTAGAPQPQKRFTYAPRHAWVKNAAGGYSQAPGPIHVLTAVSFCKSTAALENGGCAGGGADEVVTTYDYGPDSGPNNLVLRGTTLDPGGLAIRSCQSADASGNTISQTGPRGTCN